jgi:hypothetical protein
LLTAAPPVDDGGVKFTDNCPLPAIIDVIVGAPGTAKTTPDVGVTETVDDAVPSPTLFTARNFTLYVVPFTNAVAASERIVITTGVAASAGLNAFHDVPLSVEYL